MIPLLKFFQKELPVLFNDIEYDDEYKGEKIPLPEVEVVEIYNTYAYGNTRDARDANSTGQCKEYSYSCPNYGKKHDYAEGVEKLVCSSCFIPFNQPKLKEDLGKVTKAVILNENQKETCIEIECPWLVEEGCANPDGSGCPIRKGTVGK